MTELNVRSHVFKIILVGAQAVGKSSLICRYVDGTFKDEYFTTIGMDFKLHNLTVGQQQLKLQIWDTAGQQRFQALAANHFKGSHGCICVVDITKPQSLSSGRFYLDKAIKEYGIDPNCIFLVANKIDLEAKRSVSNQSIEELGDEFNVGVIYVSAKNGNGINKLFQDLSRRMLQLKGQNNFETSTLHQNPKISFQTKQQKCAC